MAITITTTIADDASPFKVTLTPRSGFNALFQINDGPQFDTAWIPELIGLLDAAREVAEPNEANKPLLSETVGGKKKKHPKM